MKSQDRTEHLQIRLSKSEKNRVASRAKKLGCSLSDLIRNAALGVDCDANAYEKKMRALKCRMADLCNVTLLSPEAKELIRAVGDKIWPY